MSEGKKRKSKSQEILEHAQAIKAFCEKKDVLDCVACSFNDKSKGCRLRRPHLWNIPNAKESKE